jgi:hypothetical protein
MRAGGVRRIIGRVERDRDCPVCDGTPNVLLVMRHPAMLRFTRELLEREFACWVWSAVHAGPRVARQIERNPPDVLVIDAADFPACCLDALAGFPRERVCVIGPEPDLSYRRAALGNGAGAWLPRDRVGDDLGRELRRVLGCVHDPCPPGRRAPRSTSSPPAGGDMAGASPEDGHEDHDSRG